MYEAWRLLDYSSSDSRVDFAVNEAIFMSRREGTSQDTLRLWQGPHLIALGASASYEKDVNAKACRRHGVEVVRAASVGADMLYQDEGSLNFAVATKTVSFPKRWEPVLSDYRVINECVVRGLQKLNLKASADPYGVYMNNKKISKALPKWFYDFLLFQGTILISANLDFYNVLTTNRTPLEKKETLTTLTLETTQQIETRKLKDALVEGFEEILGVKFERKGLTPDEQKLSEKLYKNKYNSGEWNVNGREPFLLDMGKIGVEVFVAYPPTSKCYDIINLVNEVTSSLQEEVQVMVWMRGKGQNQNGPYAAMSPGLIDAHKASRIPAIIVNGQLVFQESAPSKEALRKVIMKALD